MHISTVALAAFVGSALGGVLALIHLFRPRRAVAHWAFVAGMIALAVEALFGGLSAYASDPFDVIIWQQRRLLTLSFIPGLWILFSLTYARGGTRRLAGGWRWVTIGLLLLCPCFVAFYRGDLVYPAHAKNDDTRWVIALGWPAIAEYAFVVVSAVLVVMNLERTFRAAVGTMRWRIKFMLLGVGLLFVVRVYTSSQALLYRSVDIQLGTLNYVALVVSSVLIARSFFRTREFEVDVYPSQSVLQGSITILLAGIYLVFVGVLAKVTKYLGGDSAFALKAFVALVSLVALAVLLQSDRARLHLRRYVSRNFQRPLFDYRTVWRKYTEGTASRVERADLCRALVKMTAETFQALSVAIWLLDDKKEKMALTASTFLPGGEGREIQIEGPATALVVAHFSGHAEPVDIESSGADWAAALREAHPSQFPNGGHRVGVALVSQGDVVGVMTLGDRVGGAAFTLQDFDMLKCIGDHAAAGLRNAQLSKKLLQAKELEAFQTMAAFFVHDLKNAASTLNLMLQNLPVHFDDPAFREDSLRGVAKTVAHINRLIGRLSLLRHEQRLQVTDLDLNEIVTAALTGLEQGVGSVLTKDLQSVPMMKLDREQITKVVTNLVLNAAEAVAADGHVRVETRLEVSWVVLKVSDDGCGMTEEFLSTGLFRPFQTTKKSGLGIGMFQSKTIVEGHGGRIEVASEPGKGTTFEVFLPITRRIP